MRFQIAKPQFALLISILLCKTAGFAQTKPVSFDLFKYGELRSNLTHTQTKSARPKLIKAGKKRFQAFIDKKTERELFRVDVGTSEAMYWVYGLIDEADYNRDGVPDFCWHGGDDTSMLNLLVLSSPTGYRKIDVYGSLEREWKRRFPSDPLEDLHNSDTADVTEIVLVRYGGRLSLNALVSFRDIFKENVEDIKTYTHRVRVPESRFLQVK